MANKVKTISISILVALALGAIGYGAGRWQGNQQTAQVQSKLDSTRSDLAAQAKQAQAHLDECQRQVERLEARRQLHMAMEELAAMNFGYAQQHLSSAANMLAESAPDGSSVAELAKQVKGIEIQPTAPLDQQRAQLRHLIDRFDQIVPAAKK